MLVFPDDFVKTDKLERYNIRFLPNILELGNIATSSKKKNLLWVNKHYSYALINRYDTGISGWTGDDRFKMGDVSIIRYSNVVYDFINEYEKKIFDIESPYSISYDIRYKKSTKRENLKYLQAVGNIIYSEIIPGKDDKESVNKWLLSVDKTIEELAIDNSDDPHKSELIKKYIKVVRDKKIDEIINK